MPSLIEQFHSGVVRPVRHDDSRGSVFEVVRFKEITGLGHGQLFVTTALPGQSKGHHYHTRKTEWFCVISGHGEMVLQDPETGERATMPLTEAEPAVVRIPLRLAHALRNVGQTRLVALVCVDEVFDPADADTHPHRLF